MIAFRLSHPSREHEPSVQFDTCYLARATRR